MPQPFIDKLLKFFDENYEKSKFNIFFGSLVCLVGHPIYWAVCVYIVKERYDSAFFRFSSSLSSVLILILLAYTSKKNSNAKPWLMISWYLWVMWILPITFTYLMLINDFSKIWLVAQTIMIFMVILIINNILLIFLILSLGVFFGYLFYDHLFGYHLTISFREIASILSLFPFAFFCGTLFLAKAKSGDFESKKATIFKFLAGAIAHELRNPLATIGAVAINVENYINQIKKNIFFNEEIDEINKNIKNEDLVKKILNNSENFKNEKKQLTQFVDSVNQSVRHANDIIDIVLSDISEKKIDESDFIYLSAFEVIETIQKYYPQNLYSKKIIYEIPDPEKFNNLYFKTTIERFYFIFNNIIKNALYYSNQLPDIIITISFDQKIISGKKYNLINFLDNGPGISKHNIRKLFNDFSTFNKKGGTGLGLAFCKKNMNLFGGNIDCESKYGEGERGWTRFSLLFPYPSKEDVLKTKELSQQKKILIVDDHEINLIALKTKIQKLLPNILCETISNSREAINLAKNKKFDLILMDIQMPEIDGIESARIIKKVNKNLPIISATSLDYETFYEDLKNRGNVNDFSGYISKSSPSNQIARTISKLLFDYEDNLSYLGSKIDVIYNKVAGKKIILADDQELNLVMTRKILEKLNVILIEARNGVEILNLYKNSLDSHGKSSFDAIITDINMDLLNGDEASSEIRIIEEANNVEFYNKIPIIAITGDGSQESVHNYFKNGINDYFVKGKNFQILIKILANNFINIDIDKDYMDNSVNNLKVPEININSNNIFNTNFISNFSNEEKIKILNLFIDDSKQIISKIKKYNSIGNSEIVNSYLHSLKGILANVGAEKMFNYVKTIDKIYNTKATNEDWLKNIDDLHLELLKELDKFLA